MKSEDNFRGASDLHGAGGEWKVARQRLPWDILEAFRDAAEEIGIPRRDDFNDGNNEGSGFFEVNQRNGIRWTAAKAFLRPARKRPNLRVVTGALVTEHRLRRPARARGVRYRLGGEDRAGGRADGEVLLAAGAINSPKLLELSGIGDPDVLRGHGIAVRHALPGVGENLQDHLQIRTVFRVTGARTLNQLANSRLGKMGMALEYALCRRGPLSMAPSQFGMFTRSDETVATPDLEYHVQPLSDRQAGRPAAPLPGRHGLGLQSAAGKPRHLPHPEPRSGGAAGDPAQLPERRARPGCRAQGRAAGAAARRRARRSRRYAPEEILPGPGGDGDADIARRDRQHRHDDLPPGRHLPHGQRRRRRGRRRGSGFAGSTACASSMPRSCRRSSRATPPRPS